MRRSQEHQRRIPAAIGGLVSVPRARGSRSLWGAAFIQAEQQGLGEYLEMRTLAKPACSLPDTCGIVLSWSALSCSSARLYLRFLFQAASRVRQRFLGGERLTRAELLGSAIFLREAGKLYDAS